MCGHLLYSMPLLHGDSGIWDEGVASWLHANGPRQSCPPRPHGTLHAQRRPARAVWRNAATGCCALETGFALKTWPCGFLVATSLVSSPQSSSTNCRRPRSLLLADASLTKSTCSRCVSAFFACVFRLAVSSRAAQSSRIWGRFFLLASPHATSGTCSSTNGPLVRNKTLAIHSTRTRHASGVRTSTADLPTLARLLPPISLLPRCQISRSGAVTELLQR
jgi:hypothetical protein